MQNGCELNNILDYEDDGTAKQQGNMPYFEVINSFIYAGSAMLTAIVLLVCRSFPFHLKRGVLLPRSSYCFIQLAHKVQANYNNRNAYLMRCRIRECKTLL